MVELSIKFRDDIKSSWWLGLLMDAEVGARVIHRYLNNCSVFQETCTRSSIALFCFGYNLNNYAHWISISLLFSGCVGDTWAIKR